MNRYQLSIQTDTDSINLTSFSNKKKALKEAAYYRTGGIAYRNCFSPAAHPMVDLYDAKEERSIYWQPMFKYALKP